MLHVLRFSEDYAKIKERVSKHTDDRKEGKDMLDCRKITDDEAIKQAVNELHKINANPGTRAHLETICLLSKFHEVKHHVSVKLDMDEMDITSAESKTHMRKLRSM